MTQERMDEISQLLSSKGTYLVYGFSSHFHFVNIYLTCIPFSIRYLLGIIITMQRTLSSHLWQTCT